MSDIIKREIGRLSQEVQQEPCLIPKAFTSEEGNCHLIAEVSRIQFSKRKNLNKSRAERHSNSLPVYTENC